MWTIIHPRMTMDHLGFIPMFVSASDDRPLIEQIDQNYAHGGGWSSTGMAKMQVNTETLIARFPGDPPLKAHAKFEHPNGEKLVVYDYAIVAVIKADGTYECSRLD